MNIEAPTFNALNKPQKRALILRDQLRYLDPYHLDSFLEGVSDHEPPTYIRLNGAIKPELALVTLKEEATYFDLGNVLLSEGNAVHRVYLVAENGQIQMRMEDPLPLDDDVLDSLPIHGFIARGMIPLFKEKFQAVQSRMSKINELRRAAYNMANKTSTPVHEGETHPRPNPLKNKQVPTASPSKPPTTPKPNQEAKQHVSNKRKRTKLDTVPEEDKNRTLDTIHKDTKSRILDTIPSDIKISLFNTIVDTSFPHFDNVITASRKVVSIHSACSSDSAALHHSIDALKRALQDFDEAFGKPVNHETLSYRHDLEGSSSSSPDSIPHMNPRLSSSTSTFNTPQHPSPSPLRNSDSQPHHASITALHQESVMRFQSSNASGSPHSADTRGGQANFLGNSMLGASKVTGTDGVAPVVNMVPALQQKDGRRESIGDKDGNGMDI